jgi:hypothetical protein
MATKNTTTMDQFFEVNVELARGVKPGAALQAQVQAAMVAKLERLNAEFRKLRASIGPKADPQVHLVEHAHPDYFAPGVKHKWVKR